MIICRYLRKPFILAILIFAVYGCSNDTSKPENIDVHEQTDTSSLPEVNEPIFETEESVHDETETNWEEPDPIELEPVESPAKPEKPKPKPVDLPAKKNVPKSSSADKAVPVVTAPDKAITSSPEPAGSSKPKPKPKPKPIVSNPVVSSPEDSEPVLVTPKGATTDEPINEQSEPQQAGSTITDDVNNSINTGANEPFSSYRVVLTVDSIIEMNESGFLKVFIGAPEMEVNTLEGQVSDETTIPSSLGNYAKITPVAPDFEVSSTNESTCYKIHPSGLEVVFVLKPKASEGKFRVSANVELYKATNCQGASYPKTSKTLSVNVIVDREKELDKKIDELKEIGWDKFLIFWGALLTLLFGIILFLIRRMVKRKTGFEEGNDNE